jgi:hypothetical protein
MKNTKRWLYKNIQETTTQYLNLNISDWSIPHWNVKYKWIVFSEHNETASNHYDKQWSDKRQHLITIFLHLLYRSFLFITISTVPFGVTLVYMYRRFWYVANSTVLVCVNVTHFWWMHKRCVLWDLPSIDTTRLMTFHYQVCSLYVFACVRWVCWSE